jgi:hypothetical protein
LRDVFFAATVAKDAKVSKREVVRGGLGLLCVRGFFAATVAKDVKVK